MQSRLGLHVGGEDLSVRAGVDEEGVTAPPPFDFDHIERNVM